MQRVVKWTVSLLQFRLKILSHLSWAFSISGHFIIVSVNSRLVLLFVEADLKMDQYFKEPVKKEWICYEIYEWINLFWASFLLPKSSCIFRKEKTNAKVCFGIFLKTNWESIDSHFKSKTKKLCIHLPFIGTFFLGKNEQFVIRTLLSNLQVSLEDIISNLCFTLSCWALWYLKWIIHCTLA